MHHFGAFVSAPLTRKGGALETSTSDAGSSPHEREEMQLQHHIWEAKPPPMAPRRCMSFRLHILANIPGSRTPSMFYFILSKFCATRTTHCRATYGLSCTAAGKEWMLCSAAPEAPHSCILNKKRNLVGGVIGETMKVQNIKEYFGWLPSHRSSSSTNSLEGMLSGGVEEMLQKAIIHLASR